MFNRYSRSRRWDFAQKYRINLKEIRVKMKLSKILRPVRGRLAPLVYARGM